MASKFAQKVPQLGRKPVYLPNFTLTLLNNPKLPPNFASFIVPLNLNKLDLRDYLWNCYGIPVRGVRSYIQMQKIQQDRNNAKRISARRWFRPRSVKKMMVEMDEPFVWPEAPEDFEAWDKSFEDRKDEFNEKQQQQNRPDYLQKPVSDRGTIAEQAKELLDGKEWRQNDLEWEEVEKDVQI